MPSRESELYKDKIEVSLDGRQIFYLFFGGAVIVGLVFVLGVLVGRRVESRGHLDRAETQAASDPLAALDRLERSDSLSFRGALTGNPPASEVEKAISELEKRRAAGKPEVKVKPEVKPDAKPDAKPEVAKPDKAEVKPEPVARTEKLEAKPEPVTRPDADKPRIDKSEKADRSDKSDKPDKHDSERRSKKHDDSEPRSDAKPDRSDAKRPDAKAEAKADKPVTKPDGKEIRTEARSDDAKVKFTLQLSSFQDKTEAEAFLTAMRTAGFQPYLTEADVGGKGTFYRVRLGSYRSLDAANDAKAEFEKTARKTAQVMRL